jgi:hypothetical protein
VWYYGIFHKIGKLHGAFMDIFDPTEGCFFTIRIAGLMIIFVEKIDYSMM